MSILQKAIQKAILLSGDTILMSSVEMNRILEDLVPEQMAERKQFRRLYTDDLGEILAAANKAAIPEKSKFRSEAVEYLQEIIGLTEERSQEFLELFTEILVGKTVEVRKYRDYKPALYLLKKEYGDNLNEDIILNFVESNRLFARFSITVDDVIRDLSQTYL